MIHASVGMATSRVRIAAPDAQLRTMRMRSVTRTMGSAAEEAAGPVIRDLYIEYQ
jgi:hypothetical protein